VTSGQDQSNVGAGARTAARTNARTRASGDARTNARLRRRPHERPDARYSGDVPASSGSLRTLSTLPDGSRNQAISGPPRRLMPRSSVMPS